MAQRALRGRVCGEQRMERCLPFGQSQLDLDGYRTLWSASRRCAAFRREEPLRRLALGARLRSCEALLEGVTDQHRGDGEETSSCREERHPARSYQYRFPVSGRLTSPLTLRDDARVLLRVYLSGLVLLAGCATHPSVSRVSVRQTPARLEVLELPPSVEDRPLRRVLHGKREEATAATLIEDRQRINHSLEAMVRENLPCIASSTGAPAEITRIDDPSVRIGRPIDTASLSRLQSSHLADAYVAPESH